MPTLQSLRILLAIDLTFLSYGLLPYQQRLLLALPQRMEFPNGLQLEATTQPPSLSTSKTRDAFPKVSLDANVKCVSMFPCQPPPFLDSDSFDVVYFRHEHEDELGVDTAEKQARSRKFLRKRERVMGRPSKNPNKLPFQMRREELKLSREQAVKDLPEMTYDRLEGIENRRIAATPEDILLLAKRYNDPSLCNAYCSGQCKIGQQYVPEVRVGELPSIVLGMVATLNNVGTMKDRLIAIAADGVIDESEREDFKAIQNQLEELSIAVEALQLWVEKTLDKQ